MTMTPLSKRLIIALVVSVAVNLLFAGVLAGAAIHRSRMRAERGQMLPGPRGMGPRELGPRSDERRLKAERGPRDDRGVRDDRDDRGRREGRSPRRGGAFGGLLTEDLRGRRESALKARAAVHDALTHEPFDVAAFERSLTALRTETATTQELLHKKMLELARTGDAETRAKLARGFEPRGGGP
jgi:uncharacterized membrane protein